MNPNSTTSIMFFAFGNPKKTWILDWPHQISTILFYNTMSHHIIYSVKYSYIQYLNTNPSIQKLAEKSSASLAASRRVASRSREALPKLRLSLRGLHSLCWWSWKMKCWCLGTAGSTRYPRVKMQKTSGFPRKMIFKW